MRENICMYICICVYMNVGMGGVCVCVCILFDTVQHRRDISFRSSDEEGISLRALRNYELFPDLHIILPVIKGTFYKWKYLSTVK